ncbi:hypothetical protein O181_128168, partial [Austropuccinia psidii MF-1]|nr:hypothetical protein [Austropuccinia psidii MF-1]
MKYLPSLDLEYLNKNSVQNRESTKVNENTFDPPVADIEGNLGYTELTKLSKEEGIEQKTENTSFNQQEEKSINMKESPMSTTKSNSIDHSTNSKEEYSPTPHHHSDRDNPNLNLETNHFSLDKAKEIQINQNKEINEEISNKQGKKDQEALSKQQNMEELSTDGILLTEDRFPWEGYTDWQPLRNESCNLELYKISEKDHQCSAQHVNWLKELKKEPKGKEYWERILPNNQVNLKEKISETTEDRYSINPRLKGPANISIQAKEHEHKVTHHYGHLPHPENYFGRENKNIKSNLVKRISKKSYKNERRRAKPYDRIAPNQKLSTRLPLHLAHRHLTSNQKENLLEYKKEENNYFSTQ